MSDKDGPQTATVDDGGEVPRVHQPRRALPTDVVRPTRAEVNLANLRHNLGVLQKATPQSSVWAVLKADGYGHGAKAVARTLERAGADGICVALVEEGVELREAGIRVPILVMGGYYGNAQRELAHFRLIPVLSDGAQVESLARAAGYAGARPAVHLKVDTGMARLGTRPEDWPRLVDSLPSYPQLRVEGLMTHLGNAESADTEALDTPLRLFEEARKKLAERQNPLLLHMANSAALLRDSRTHFDVVRPGIALFGVDPLAATIVHPKEKKPSIGRLKPTMKVQSAIVSLRNLNKGDSVGYGSTFLAQKPTRIATVPMGYADGLTRALSNRASVLIGGRRAPIVGSISMDMCMVDVSAIATVALGDEVVFLGSQDTGEFRDTITVEEVAQWSDSIPWEVLTNISRRVPRFYRES